MCQAEENYIIPPIQTVAHPWIRFFARMLDINLYILIWIAFAQRILRLNSANITFGALFDSYIAYGIMLLIEPLFLWTWGTTPGKWLFGLVVRDTGGSKLDYKRALARTWGVFGAGIGYNIPIYSLYRYYKSYKTCSEAESLSWEESCSYTIKDTKAYRPVLYVVTFILLAVITYFNSLQAMMPINRGNITAAEYAENCNDFIRYTGYKLNRTMNEQGDWLEDPNGGVYELLLGSGVTPSHTIITEGDKVTGIKIEVEITDGSYIDGFANQKLIAAMGFLAAQPKMNCFKLRNNQAFRQLRKSFENYTDYEAGIRIKNEVEYTGYYMLNDNILYPNDKEKPYFHMIFTLEKVN